MAMVDHQPSLNEGLSWEGAMHSMPYYNSNFSTNSFANRDLNNSQPILSAVSPWQTSQTKLLQEPLLVLQNQPFQIPTNYPPYSGWNREPPTSKPKIKDDDKKFSTTRTMKHSASVSVSSEYSKSSAPNQPVRSSLASSNSSSTYSVPSYAAQHTTGGSMPYHLTGHPLYSLSAQQQKQQQMYYEELSKKYYSTHNSPLFPPRPLSVPPGLGVGVPPGFGMAPPGPLNIMPPPALSCPHTVYRELPSDAEISSSHIKLPPDYMSPEDRQRLCSQDFRPKSFIQQKPIISHEFSNKSYSGLKPTSSSTQPLAEPKTSNQTSSFFPPRPSTPFNHQESATETKGAILPPTTTTNSSSTISTAPITIDWDRYKSFTPSSPISSVPPTYFYSSYAAGAYDIPAYRPMVGEIQGIEPSLLTQSARGLPNGYDHPPYIFDRLEKESSMWQYHPSHENISKNQFEPTMVKPTSPPTSLPPWSPYYNTTYRRYGPYSTQNPPTSTNLEEPEKSVINEPDRSKNRLGSQVEDKPKMTPGERAKKALERDAKFMMRHHGYSRSKTPPPGLFAYHPSAGAHSGGKPSSREAPPTAEPRNVTKTGLRRSKSFSNEPKRRYADHTNDKRDPGYFTRSHTFHGPMVSTQQYPVLRQNGFDEDQRISQRSEKEDVKTDEKTQLVSDVRSSRDGNDKISRMDRDIVDRNSRMDRSDVVDRTLRLDKDDRIARNDKSDTIDRNSRMERYDALSRDSRMGTDGRLSRSNDIAERNSRMDRYDAADRASRMDREDRISRNDKSDVIERSSRIDRFDAIDRNAKIDKEDRNSRTDKSDLMNKDSKLDTEMKERNSRRSIFEKERDSDQSYTASIPPYMSTRIPTFSSRYQSQMKRHEPTPVRSTSFLEELRRGSSIFALPRPQSSAQEPQVAVSPRTREKQIDERISHDEEVAAYNAMRNAMNSQNASYEYKRRSRSSSASHSRSVRFSNDVTVATCLSEAEEALPVHISSTPLKETAPHYIQYPSMPPGGHYAPHMPPFYQGSRDFREDSPPHRLVPQLWRDPEAAPGPQELAGSDAGLPGGEPVYTPHYSSQYDHNMTSIGYRRG